MYQNINLIITVAFIGEQMLLEKQGANQYNAIEMMGRYCVVVIGHTGASIEYPYTWVTLIWVTKISGMIPSFWRENGGKTNNDCVIYTPSFVAPRAAETGNASGGIFALSLYAAKYSHNVVNGVVR